MASSLSSSIVCVCQNHDSAVFYQFISTAQQAQMNKNDYHCTTPYLIVTFICFSQPFSFFHPSYSETRHFHLIAPIKYPNGDAPPRALRYSQFIAGRIRNTKKETTASPDKTAAASVPAATATMEPPTPEAPKTPPKSKLTT